MISQSAQNLSPFQNFSRIEWASLRANMSATLTAEQVEKFKSLNDQLSIKEVEEIYSPLARLLWYYVKATQQLHTATGKFLGQEAAKTPYIIGVAGSVAVGKSTTARVLQALLAQWKTKPKVDLITTDGFLLPNAILEAQDLMNKKGFPQSYDLPALLKFLNDVKAGKRNVRAPIYSHISYDIVPDKHEEIDQPDILIVEGLNLFQVGRAPKEGEAIPFVSDFFDFSIYLDADVTLIEQWYLERFMQLRETAFKNPDAYFRRFAEMPKDEMVALAKKIWAEINLVNLTENILPTRQRANLILTKGADHLIERVSLRKL